VLAKANFLGFVMTEAPIPYHPPRERAPEARDQLRRDLKRVFFSPDFGPYPLPPPAGAAPVPG
jgi:hypothetical protein